MDTAPFDAIHLKPGPNGKHLLVAVDQSECSYDAVKLATDLMGEEDVLTCYTVLNPTDLHGKTDVNYRTIVMTTIHERVKAITSKKFRVHADFNVDAKAQILEKLKSYQMVVIGSTGKTMVQGVLLGSVGQFLLNKSPIPVVIYRK